MNPEGYGKMDSENRNRNTQAPLIHQSYRTFKSCSSRSTSTRLDTSSYSTSTTSIDTSNSTLIPNDEKEELGSSALRRYPARFLNTEVGKSRHTSNGTQHPHGDVPKDNDNCFFAIKNHNNFKKISFGSRRLKQSNRREIIILNNHESQQDTNLHSHNSAKRRPKDYNKERGDSNSYIGVYPHIPSLIPRSHVQVNLLSATNPPGIKSNDIGLSSDKDVVLKCVQKSTGHLENGTMATQTERIRRTNEWFDRQPRPVAFPQINDSSIRPLELEENIRSIEGVEPNQRCKSPLNCLGTVPDSLLRETSDASIPNNIQDEAAVSKGPEEQDNTVKREHRLPYRGRLQVIIHHAAQCQGGSPAATSTTSSQPNQKGNSLGLSQTGGSRYSESRKRKMGGGNPGNDPGDDSDDDSDEDYPRRPRSTSGKGKAAKPPSLACPYFKHNPKKYVGRKWSSCCLRSWDTVHRVKEHLYRCHRQPKYICKRCGEDFEEEKSLENHMREPEACILQDLKPLDGFDSNQEAKLKSRKKPKPPTKLSEPDKWKLTYMILFPHVPEDRIPSPFYDYTESLLNSISDYREFARQEIVLGGFRATLERDFENIFKIVDNSSKKKAVEWYLDTQLKLIKIFQDIPLSGSSLSSTFANPRSPTIGVTEFPTLSPIPDDVARHPSDALTALLGFSKDGDNDVLFGESALLELEELTSCHPSRLTVEESPDSGETQLTDSAYESMSAKHSVRHLPG